MDPGRAAGRKKEIDTERATPPWPLEGGREGGKGGVGWGRGGAVRLVDGSAERLGLI